MAALAVRRIQVWGVSEVALLLSGLLHLGVALWLVWDRLAPPVPTLPPAVDIDLVPDSAKPPEPPPPPTPQPQAQSTPLPARPQLEDGALSDKSTPSGHQGEASHTTGAGTATPSREPARKEGKHQATQTVRDKVLAQVLRHWDVPEELRGFNRPIQDISVDVQPDGYLADFYSARLPWNPASAVEHYTDYPPGSLERRTVESIYRALRQAQPLKLPPEVLAKAPLTVKLVFRPADVLR